MKCLRALRFSLVVLATACGSEEQKPAVPEVDGLDTSEAGLVAFLRQGGYQGWLAEPSVHEGSGPHGQVRVFFNDTVTQSLRDDNATHPVGSILVKELYAPDGQLLIGHALEVKVEAGADKDTWLFFEGFLPDYPNPYYGRGHATCHGCHSAGKDYVTTELPR